MQYLPNSAPKKGEKGEKKGGMITYQTHFGGIVSNKINLM